MKKIATVVKRVAAMIAAMLRTKNKKNVAVTIIDGADGPTSIFLAGTIGNKNSARIMIAGVVLILIAILVRMSKRFTA